MWMCYLQIVILFIYLFIYLFIIVKLTCVISVIAKNKLNAHDKTHLHTMKVVTILIPCFHGLR